MGIKHLLTCSPTLASHLVNWLPTLIQRSLGITRDARDPHLTHLAHEKTYPEREATHWNLFSWKT